MTESTPNNGMTGGGSELQARQGTILSALDYFKTRPLLYRQGLILKNLVQWKPQLIYLRCWMGAAMAEDAGEVGVTEPLRIPAYDRHGADLKFFETVMADMEDCGADWSVVMEYKDGEHCVSIWRKPAEGHVYEL